MDKIGEEIRGRTKIILISRLDSILEKLKYEESDLKEIGKEEIRTLQAEIELGDIMPF